MAQARRQFERSIHKFCKRNYTPIMADGDFQIPACLGCRNVTAKDGAPDRTADLGVDEGRGQEVVIRRSKSQRRGRTRFRAAPI